MTLKEHWLPIPCFPDKNPQDKVFYVLVEKKLRFGSVYELRQYAQANGLKEYTIRMD